MLMLALKSSQWTVRDTCFIAGLLTFCALAFYAILSFMRWRAQRLKRVGVEMGMRPFQKGEPLHLPDFYLMHRPGRAIGGAFEGDFAGREIKLFDLYYSAGKGTGHCTCVALRSPGSDLPRFLLTPVEYLTYLPSVPSPRLTLDGFDSDFAKHWMGYCDDQQALESLLSPALRHVLLELPANRMSLTGGSTWSFEGYRDWVVLYRRGYPAPIAKLQDFLQQGSDVAAQFMAAANVPQRAPGTPEPDYTPHLPGSSRRYTFKVTFKV